MDEIRYFKRMEIQYISDVFQLISSMFFTGMSLNMLVQLWKSMLPIDVFTLVLGLGATLILLGIIIISMWGLFVLHKNSPLTIGIDIERIYLKRYFSENYIDISSIKEIKHVRTTRYYKPDGWAIVYDNNEVVKLRHDDYSKMNLFMDELNKRMFELQSVK